MKLAFGTRSRKEQQAYSAAAQQELQELRSALAEAYRVFNRTADPALLEASILEISALQVRFDRLLRSIKDMNGESQNAARNHRAAGHRGRAHLSADQAVEKADQMGV